MRIRVVNKRRFLISAGAIALSGVILLGALVWGALSLRANGERAEMSQEVENTEAYAENAEPAGEDAGGSTAAQYVSERYGFSLEYPAALVVKTFEEVEKETLLFSSDNPEEGFRMVVRPLESALEAVRPMTVERVREYEPETAIESPVQLMLDNTVPALLFWSTEGEGEETRELRFSANGHWFAVSASRTYDDTLAHIFTTLEFTP